MITPGDPRYDDARGVFFSGFDRRPAAIARVASRSAKIGAMKCFESQLHEFPGPRSLEALKALALFRGSQAGYGYAEAFQIIRMGAELFL